tara:strand:- start:107 stop:364 length:258 start_codon:yes stop_codon:yes gene_type:complete
MMKKLPFLALLSFYVIFFTSCAEESKYISNLPKIDGYEVKNIYRLNTNLLATYMDLSGNSLVFKLNENSETWKRILFKTKASFKH